MSSVRFAVRGRLAMAGGSRQGAVVVEGERIAAVVSDPRPADLPAEVREAEWIAPGFVDWQVNGGFGADVVSDPTALALLARRLPETGVTTFLPTAISASFDRYHRLAEWLAGHDETGAQPVGLHLEGPFLAPHRAGAHDRAFVEAAERDPSLFDRLVGLAGLRLVTLAPERPGALDRIARLRERGIAVSLGHTAADHDRLRAGVDAGASMITHLYNAMTGFAHRAPGATGAALVDDRVVLGVIADGLHCHPSAVALAVRAAGVDRISLVTDAVAAAGMAAGRYQLAGREVAVDEEGGSVRLEDGTLAGSTLSMDRAVRNVVAWCGVAPEHALRMASAPASRALGLSDRGDLVPAARADLVLLDGDLRVEATYVAGRRVYDRHEKR